MDVEFLKKICLNEKVFGEIKVINVKFKCSRLTHYSPMLLF